jgi:hypothetical protein
MAIRFSNNARSTLASGITASATSLTVVDGSVFPALAPGDHTYVTLEDVSGNLEVVKVTAISSNTLTVIRGQDGTTARAYSSGDFVQLRVTAALLNDLADEASVTLWADVQNKPDPVITLAGDATGSATLTDLGSATLNVTVANDSHTHDGRYYTESEADSRFVNAAGDTMTGELTFQDDNEGITFLGGGRFYKQSGQGLVIRKPNGGQELRFEDNSGNYLGTFWHSGNDGASSGLDADLLDGQHGSYYQPASTALTTSTTFGGDVSGTYNAIVIADDSHNHVISNVDGLQAALDSKLTSSSALSASNITSGTLNNARLEANVFVNDGGTYSVGFAGDVNDVTGFQVLRVTGFTGTDHRAFSSHHNMLNIPNTSSVSYVAQIGFETGGTGLRWRSSSNGTFTSWYDVWHAGNDGASSGLDADLLDGQHGSYYAPASSLSGYVAKTGDTMSGNLSFADGAKAIFGAGSDLQIYHDGSNSYIADAGDGDLILRGSTGIKLQSASGVLEYLSTNSTNGSVELKLSGATKLTTTSTGIDVTGTVTADGLTVSGDSSFGNITTSGYLRGPATFTIDPAAHGDNTGTVVIAGNLQVDGTTTTINSTTLTVDDKNIVLASGSINAAAADGAGITIDGATGATFTYNATNDTFVSGKWMETPSLRFGAGVYGSAINAKAGYLLLQKDEALPIELWGSVIESRKIHYFGGGSATAPAYIDTSGNFSTTGTLTASGGVSAGLDVTAGRDFALGRSDQSPAFIIENYNYFRLVANRQNDPKTSTVGVNPSGVFYTSTGFAVNSTTVIDSSRNLVNVGTISSGAITTGYGLHLTNGNTNFLLYNNTNENVLYMRDSTNGQMLTTWYTDKFVVNKALEVIGGNASITNGGLAVNSSPSASSPALDVQGYNNTDGTVALRPNGAKGSRVSHIHYGTTGDWYIRSASTSGTVVIQDSGGSISLCGATVDSGRNFSNVGTISSGAITSSGTIYTTGGNFRNGSYTAGGYETNLGANALTFKRDGSSYIDQAGTGDIVFRLGSSYSSTFKINTSGVDVLSGGLSIGSTEVISSSRNLTNIGSISATSASLSGNLTFGNSGTSKRGVIGTAGDNDQWFIGGAATGSNAGYMEISVGDDGTEPIYVRQYYNGTPLTGAVLRTLTLLDSSGNTSIPGSLTIGGSLSAGASGTTQYFREIRVGASSGGSGQTGIIKENGYTYGLGLFTWGDNAPVRLGGSVVNLQRESGAGSPLQMAGTTVIDSSRRIQNVSFDNYLKYTAGWTGNSLEAAEAMHMNAGWGSVLQDSLQFNAALFRVPVMYAKSGSTWTNIGNQPQLCDGKVPSNWGRVTLSRSYDEFIFYFGTDLGYTFISAVTLLHSTSGNSMQIYVESSETGGATDTGWTVMAATGSTGSWPGSTTLTMQSGVGGGFNDRFRIRIVPSWDHASNSISLGQIVVRAGYGGYVRLFDWDHDRKIYFSADVTIDGAQFTAGASNGGSLRVYSNSIGASNYTQGLMHDGNYTNGQYRHRWRKQDNGGGVPLYLDYSAGTANSYTTIARFGPYSGNTESFEVYGAAKVSGALTSTKANIGYIRVGHSSLGDTGAYVNNIEATGSYFLLQRNEAVPIEIWGSAIESRKNHYFGGSSTTAPAYIDTSGNASMVSYRVSGTTVIDSARNLTNISSISVTAGSSYPVQVSSTQRYQMQIRNPNNTTQSSWGWWLAHDTNFNFVLHADGQGDKLTLTSAGDMTLAGGLVTNGNVNVNSGVFAASGTTVIDSSRNVFAARLKATTAVHPGSTGYWKLRDNGGGAQLVAEYSTSDALSDANIKWRVLNDGTTQQEGSLRIGSTTVIDSARSLTNVVGISASGPIRTAGGATTGFYLNNSGNHTDGLPHARLTEAWGMTFLCNDARWSPSVQGGSFLVGLISNGSNFGSGNILATGNITAYYSDERLKTRLGNIDNALEKVCSLDGFRYVNNDLAKSFGYDKDEPQLGLSAQQVQAVAPETVSLAPFDMTGDNDPKGDGKVYSKSGEDYLTVDYSRLVPLLVEAIKELKDEVESLKLQLKEKDNGNH